MSKNFLRLATSGLTVVGTAAGISLLNIAVPIELLSFTQFGQIGPKVALAQQDVEEDVNVHVYQAASPAVVSIKAGEGTGSGSIISPEGLILTNAHVVAGSDKVKVVLADGRTFEGDVIAFGEAGQDLAAVRIRDGQGNFPTVRVAAPGSVKVGQRTFAIGNPFGQFQGTFTTGIVSRIDPNRGLIQTDAAINPGNSGGPLLNSQGELIGVNTAIFAPRGASGNIGIGFAIAVDKVQPFLVAVREGRAPTTPPETPPLLGDKEPVPVALNGNPVQGQLNQSSSVLPFDNSFFNAYSFRGRAGQQVVIEMSSTDLDPYLILLAPDGGDIAQDDDGGGEKNSRVVTTLPSDGTYTILANTSSSGETGRYNLRVAAAASTPQQTSQTLLQEQGDLGPGSPVWQEDGTFYQVYRFQGNAGQVVTISMESREFDTYVLLLDPDGQLVGQNDDASSNNTNSLLTITLPRTGTYQVIANTYDRNGKGHFTLVVR